MNNMKLRRFQDATHLNQNFASEIKTCLADAIEKRGQAYLVVSGGKTPLGLFEILSHIDLDWEKVTVTLTDERLLEPTDDESNERLIKGTLLKNKAAKAKFISLYDLVETQPESCDLKNIFSELPTFDIVILGMGEDGHTASLFPCSEEIHSGLNSDSAFLLINPRKAPHKRVSLTKSRLLNSRRIFLHLLGENKLIALNKAIQGTDPYDMPIRAFIHHPKVDLQIMFAP